MAWDTENAWRPDWHGRWRSHKPGQALVEQNVARPLLRVRNTGTTERLRSCRYGAVLRACQMAIDADFNEVIANVRNGVGHWKRMATRLARTLAEPQTRSGTGRTERRAAATSGPKYRHDRTVTLGLMTAILVLGRVAPPPVGPATARRRARSRCAERDLPCSIA